MEFNLNKVLENLRKKGEALSSFGKEEDDEKKDDYYIADTEDENERSTQDSVTSIVLDKSDDEKSIDEESAEVIKTETKDKKKESEEDLEKKLKNIEKVIDTFGGSTNVLGSSKELVGTPSDNINLKPLDFSQLQARENQQEYLKPSNVQNDRIALLYEDLKKYNLI